MRCIALAFILLLSAAAHAETPAAQAVPVGVVTATRQPVSPGATYVGRVEAIQHVNVQARVTGYLESVDFTEGTVVKEGDTLYHIESAPFVAAQLQARGALLQAQGQLTNATTQLARAEELLKTSAASVQTRDDRLAARLNAQGAVIIADADLRTATINLGYTTITSPITGRIGRTALTKGNVVSPQSGVLATIVSVDPIYVTFPVSQRAFLEFNEEKARRSAADLVVRLQFSNGTEYDQLGRLNFLDVTVDRATDTIMVRAVVPNPNADLVAGQFMRVRVELKEPAQAVVIPQAALLIDQQGEYTFVAENGHAVVRRLKTGNEVGANVIIEDGVKEGEQVIVEGVMSLRPGVPVVASPAKGI
jgi:membrane fusion protein (multidrug efflux system)